MALPPRNALCVPMLLAFVASLALAVVALPGPEPVAVPAVEWSAPIEPGLIAVRKPAAPLGETPERDDVPTWERFQVIVKDADGKPVAAMPVQYYLESPVGFPEDQVGVTDAAGRFVSPVLKPGIYRVRITTVEGEPGCVREIVVPTPAGSELEFVAAPIAD